MMNLMYETHATQAEKLAKSLGAKANSMGWHKKGSLVPELRAMMDGAPEELRERVFSAYDKGYAEAGGVM